MIVKSWKPQSPSDWTMFVFGVLALILGALGILRPEIMLQMMGMDITERAQRAAGDYTLMFITASAMASFNMGAYYILASLNQMRQFYVWTVPFRFVTFTVFVLAVVNEIAPSGFIGVAAWELIGAICTGAALWYERK